METQHIIFAIVLFLTVTKVTCLPSSLNTQDSCGDQSDSQPPKDEGSDTTKTEKPGSDNSDEENSDKNTETPGDDNTGGDKTQQPGDDKTTSTSTTSKSSHLSLGFAISFSSLLISFVF
ncbi:unnamed protein product [Hymenolepis diminuta]|uniref:Uncharacterized protein n=1 Tax=Hymenolepis diminuta TaxID=6216 RepID=A0A564Y5X3_HYMDI|nr:unnamed protein product [Hymenolepis diminuta]